MQFDKVYKIKLENDNKHEARVLLKRNYKECSEKYTEFNAEYRNYTRFTTHSSTKLINVWKI